MATRCTFIALCWATSCADSIGIYYYFIFHKKKILILNAHPTTTKNTKSKRTVFLGRWSSALCCACACQTTKCSISILHCTRAQRTTSGVTSDLNDNHFFLPMISSFQSYSTLRTCLFTHLCIYSSLPPSISFSYLISLTSNFFLLHFSKFSSIMRTYRCCQQSHPLLHHSCLSSTPLPHSYTMLHLVRNLFLCFLPLVTTIILLRILFKIYFVPF